MIPSARDAGCQDITLLKCTSTYPATPENSNILPIPHMHELFSCEVGLSDHTMGNGTAVATLANGATVIEKHFTLGRADCGVDSAFSMESAELHMLLEETERNWQSLCEAVYGPTGAEKNAVLGRRSLYVAEDMKAGVGACAELL